MERDKKLRLGLIVLEIIVGMNAIGGGTALLAGAMDRWLPLTWLQGSPFTDYVIPGIALILLVGGGMLLAGVAEIRGTVRMADIASLAAGIILVSFEIVEGAAMGIRMWLQPALFIVGWLIIAIAFVLWRHDAAGRPARGPVRIH